MYHLSIMNDEVIALDTCMAFFKDLSYSQLIQITGNLLIPNVSVMKWDLTVIMIIVLINEMAFYCNNNKF